MNYICIGKIVNTHGIKGEVRILSDFPYKKEVYAASNNLYIGKKKENVVVTNFRRHKMFDMLMFDGINNINDVIQYKGEFIYFDRDEISLPGLIDEDYIGLDVYEKERYVGTVTSIMKGKSHDILVIEKENIKNLLPNISAFVKKIDILNKRIEIESIEGLLHEN